MSPPPIWIDRAIKADIGRIVAGDDRAGMLDRHRSFQRWRVAIDTGLFVQPIAIRLAGGEIEARACGIAGRTARRWGRTPWHPGNVRPESEQIQNEFQVTLCARLEDSRVGKLSGSPCSSRCYSQ